MLTTEEQLEKLNNFHKALEEKGFLDENLKREMETWKQILINSLKTNDFLNTKNEELRVELLKEMATRGGLNQQILNYKVKEQEFNRQITNLDKQKRELVGKIEKEKILTNSYREEKNEISQQAQQDRINFLNNLRDKQNKLNSLEVDLNISDELLADKNQKLALFYQDLANLTKEKNKLENKNNQKQKQIILLMKQLAADQKNNKDLIELTNRLEKKLEKSKKRKEKLINAKKYHRQQINSLNTKLTKANQEKKDLETQLATEKKNHQNTNRLVQQQQTIVKLNSQLASKDKIIQQQTQRIKELEHKPPVVQIKKEEVVKEKELTVATEYLVEVNQEIESEEQKKEIQRLNKIIQELRTQLAQKSVPINQIIVKENLPKNNIERERERERENLYCLFC